MGYTAAVHDSIALKNSSIYKNQATFFNPDEYLLADKGYGLERLTPGHQIMPGSTFNYPFRESCFWRFEGSISYTF